MKKSLAIVGVIMFAAVATQAASVNWKISGQASGKAYYLYNGDISAAISALTDGVTYEESALALPSGYVANGSLTSRGANGSLSDVAASLSVIVLDSTVAEGNKFYYSVVSTTGYTYTPPNGAPGTLQISSWTEGTFDGKSSGGGQDPIPEPTTVALLALGLAAVGLKRKVA